MGEKIKAFKTAPRSQLTGTQTSRKWSISFRSNNGYGCEITDCVTETTGQDTPNEEGIVLESTYTRSGTPF